MPIINLIKLAYGTFIKDRDCPASKKYKVHNKKLFSAFNSIYDKKSIVLTELNEMQSAHIAYSYLTNQIAEKENARIVAYKPSLSKTIRETISFKIKRLISYKCFGIYNSFGVSEFIEVKTTKSQRDEAKILVDKLQSEIRDKSDVVDLTIDGVWVGDLIYDSFLREKTLPTLNIDSKEFLEHLQKSFEIFVFWRDYFVKNKVSSIIVSHCVYTLAIPLRIAISKNIPAYQASLTHLYRLSKEEYFAYNDFFHYHKHFTRLPETVQSLGLEKAQRQIERRFSGEVGVNMAYSKKSAFTETVHENLIKKSSRKKLLVAAHCFFDSPHPYGKNLFPDCYEWLNFLGEMSKETDYDWYIKTHPDFIPANKDIIEEFIKQNPKFVFLPPNASHHQIIKEGIDVALTIYGTIGFEYAALGVPVINASLCNPHIAYNFNIHPKSQDEYENILKNLGDLDFKIDQQEVYEYYFMRHLFNTENIFFDNYAKEIEKLGGYKQQFTPEIYQSWLAQFSPEKHKTIKNALDKFINSNDFRMDNTHFGTEFLAEHIKE